MPQKVTQEILPVFNAKERQRLYHKELFPRLTGFMRREIPFDKVNGQVITLGTTDCLSQAVCVLMDMEEFEVGKVDFRIWSGNIHEHQRIREEIIKRKLQNKASIIAVHCVEEKYD